jgi:hypothetical protein
VPAGSSRLSRLSQLRAGFLAAVVGSVAAGSAALAGACGDSSTAVMAETDGGEESGSGENAECPTVEPADRSQCLLPEGTTCNFGQCGTKLAQCSRGAWISAGNATPNPPCPANPPTPDVACPACWQPGISCTYGSSDCSTADASVNTAIASCPQGTWVLDIRPCRDGGGPDVQGDAEAGAD